MNTKLITILCFVIAVLSACTPGMKKINTKSKITIDQTKLIELPPAFQSYWYNGKAEISTYSLEQARYGELRKGEAELIFVTEDFSASKLVKLDDPGLHPDDVVKVLKLNWVKQFNTGIYPYSLMTSIFSDVTSAKAIKVTASAQEWCGHAYNQLKQEKNQYHVQLHSYFEKETEQDTIFDQVWLEDELWNRIRINPSSLPTGEIRILPGLVSQRLRHTPCRPISAQAELLPSSLMKDSSKAEPANTSAFRLTYPSEQRTLTIYFQKEFPYQIQGWEETYADGFGARKKMLTTRATRKKTMLIDYWNHNTVADSVYRDSLLLRD